VLSLRMQKYTLSDVYCPTQSRNGIHACDTSEPSIWNQLFL